MVKTIGLGVSGGIAAYKVVDLASRLKKDGFEVIVIMTEGATKFVTPLTFKTITGREVLSDLWQDSQEWKVQHIGIAEEIDLLVIAPATANLIAKMTYGIADDLLSTVAVANTAPVLVVPAMNSNMYNSAVVQENLQKLKKRGYQVMQPSSGLLACGAVGPGRLPEIEEIYQQIRKMLFPKNDLEGKCLLVNAGTTCEDIDPVRFIANRSTGKMGYRIAEEAVRRGAKVYLVSGNSPLNPPEGVEFFKVWSAEDMCQIMLKLQPDCDIIIGAAAVGDFRAAVCADHKLKKTGDGNDRIILELVNTPDILQELGKRKKPGQIMVGFAAETENLLDNAKQKLEKKNLDFIVANDITIDGAGFASDTNVVTIIARDLSCTALPKLRKEEVAAAIIDRAVGLLPGIS
ncbi:MAG: bifunctional phosphopantothenoylcysteine decarboxylase/phosphopantothenate--cysteine ligase CoaBC [Syntrophomonadaceae bacterium]|jgi:phosphopantothenoylcysteine decarboxylase/phosphopantothenate--cysteine ligase